MKDEDKNIRKATREKTRERRKSQVCKSYTLKIDESHLNQNQKYFLNRIFIEAKWFYNHVLQQEDVFNSQIRKIDKPQVRVIDHFETRELKFLSSQMKTDLHERICGAIKVLSKLKKASFSVGRLKFKPEINTIGLKQYGVTWKIDKTRIKIQGVKQPFKVNGIKQIPEGCEFTCAQLVRKPSGYYIKVITFQNKEITKPTGKSVGLDFGIKTSITTSDGEKFDIKIPESKRLKRLQLGFSKKKKTDSRHRRKNIKKIKQEYEKTSRQKKDQVNKIVSYLKNNYDEIFIQEEQIANWHKGLFGKQVQHSSLGAIKSGLKQLKSTFVLSKWEPTTKLCPCCGTLNKIKLSERIYNCACGYTKDRDIHSAQNILLIGQKQKASSAMGRSSTTVEDQTSEFSKSNLGNVSHDSLKREAPSFMKG